MELKLRRIALREKYTIGKLEVLDNGTWKWIADTIEDKVRDLNKNGKFDNGEVKVKDETAIPYGTYNVTMNVKSPKYSNFAKYPWAKPYDGYLPRLLDVPAFDGILIHVGNDENSSSGCIIVGENKIVGKVVNSTDTFKRIMDNYFIPAKNRNEKIYISIV